MDQNEKYERLLALTQRVFSNQEALDFVKLFSDFVNLPTFPMNKQIMQEKGMLNLNDWAWYAAGTNLWIDALDQLLLELNNRREKARQQSQTSTQFQNTNGFRPPHPNQFGGAQSEVVPSTEVPDDVKNKWSQQ